MFDTYKMVEELPRAFMDMNMISMNYQWASGDGKRNCFNCCHARKDRKNFVREHHCFIGGFVIYRNRICDKFK